MNKERIVNKTETAIIFEKKRAMRDRDFQKIFPEDFKGDIIVNGDIFLEEVNMISGNLIVTGDIKFSRHLIVNGNIICYGNIFSKNQDALNANADLIVAYVINVYGNCEAKKIIEVR